jgi:Amt family ammonium transporter
MLKRMLEKIGWLPALAGLVAACALAVATPAQAAEEPSAAAQLANLKVAADTVWVLVTAMLVFFMNAGFAMVESGFNRSKNCVNILSKNFIVFAVTSIVFWLAGFGLMFGKGTGFVGTEGVWALAGPDNSPALKEAYQGVYDSLNWTSVPLLAKFFFQLVFAGTAATIVSGAVAERIKYLSFIVFSAVMGILIYPVTGHWIWGGGWLGTKGFLDFAGSTVVHSVGGWAALAGIMLLGPRFGKYNADGSVNPIPGHNMTSATLGALILWLGWFGFNPGSVMAADPGPIALVCVTTNTAAAAGVLSATAVSWILLGKPDLGMTLNGCLAGLVAITAPCAFVTVSSAFWIGLIAGVIVVLGVIALDKVRLDDPVGAVPVHLFNGIWGTLALGLFHTEQGALWGKGWGFFGVQLQGVLAVGAYVLVVSLVAWYALKLTLGIRVAPDEELMGLDAGEHGNIAYPDFVSRKFSVSAAAAGSRRES